MNLDPEHRRVVGDWEAVCDAVWKSGGDQVTLPTRHLRMILYVAGLALDNDK